MKLDEYFAKLCKEKLSIAEYSSLKKQCLRMVRQACRRYKINDIISNNVTKNETFDNVYIKSLIKTMDKYDKSKGSFSTYFYYKAMSAARSEVGKLKRRLKIENTIPLDESYMTGKKSKGSL